MERDPELVKMLPRQPGTKESRYAHLLSGDLESWTALPQENLTSEDDRVARLERAVEQLRGELDSIKQQLAEFRKQFD